jgi:hypothetical protein
MPVKSHSGDHNESSSESEKSKASHAANALAKREIKMPDGRYMIFYTDKKDTGSQKT